MRITAIRKTENGFKLIAARKVANFGGRYLPTGPVVFFDYKDNQLRRFNENDSFEYFCINFKEALKAILTDKIDSLIQIL
jgi:hypothetical protein